jgi:DNA-binding CsgD family transcriptional regulator
MQAMTHDRLERTRQRLVQLCHRCLDLAAYRRAAADMLRGLVDFDGCCWLTLDPATLLPTSHIALNSMKPEDVPRLAHNEYVEDDVNKFAELTHMHPPVGILKQATGGRPDLSARYRNLLQPNGFGAELRCALIDATGCWGGVALYRRADVGDFALTEAEALGELSAILAEGLRRSLLIGDSGKAVAEDAPGLIVLDREGRVEAMTPQARGLLRELVVNSPPEVELPNIVHALAYRAQVAAQGADGGEEGIARIRVPTRSGRWLVLHGSLLGALEDRRTAVIIEPARAPELAPVIAKAYGLTEREVGVAQLVMQGYSTQEISRTLYVSPYTVRDHLKSIFEKVGVHSRRELMAQVFFQQYVPRMQRSARVSSTGWFVED